MNIRKNNITKRKRTRPYIIFFISYSVLIYLTQFFYKDSLFNASLDLTRIINKNDEIRNLIPYIDRAGNFFGSFQFYGILIIFIFNSANIYKTFIFIVSILLSILISAWLKLLYRQPLMFYSDPQHSIIPLVCDGTWGNPSTNSTTSTCVYLTFWKIVFDCGRLRFKRNTK